MTRVFARLVLLPKNVSSVLSPRDRKALTCVLTAAFLAPQAEKTQTKTMFGGERSRAKREWLDQREGMTEESWARHQCHEFTKNMTPEDAQAFKSLFFPELCPKEEESQKEKKSQERQKEEQEGQEEQERTKEAGATPGGPARNTELTGSRWRSGTPRHFFAMVLFHGGEIFCFEVKCFDVFVSVGGVTYCGGHVI